MNAYQREPRLRTNRKRSLFTVIFLFLVALLFMLLMQGVFSLVYIFQLDGLDRSNLWTATSEYSRDPGLDPVSVPAHTVPTSAHPAITTNSLNPPGRIVFTCTRGGYNHICIINPDGTSFMQLTRGYYNDYYATTRDGNTIIFVSNRTGIFQIYTMRTDGSEQNMIPVILEDVSAPDLSPDENWIVFSAVKDGDKSIYRIRPDGSDLQLMFGPASDIDPNWSPDGSLISFASDYAGLVELFTIHPDGRNLQQITRGFQRIGGRNSWSPDGEWLSFYAGPQGDRDIYVIEIATSQINGLTRGGNNTGPCFSPDGNWIVFSSSRDGDHELYIMRTDGSDVRQITINDEDDWQPRWGS